MIVLALNTAGIVEDRTIYGSASPQPRHQLRRRDDDQFGRRPSQAYVEELVEAVAVGRELDEDDDLALHALEAADRFEQDLIRFVRDVLGRETPRTAVIEDCGVLQAGVAEPPMAPS